MNPDERTLLLLRRVLQRRSGVWWTRLGDVSEAQWAVLRAVHAAPGRTQQAVADETGSHKSSVVPVVRRLVARGWLRDAPDPVDGRRKRLFLTDAGRDALRRLDPVVSAVDTATLGALSVADRAALRGLLLRLTVADEAPRPARSDVLEAV